MRADFAIIGGVPEDRLTWAISLRRKGLSVASELSSRKRAKMFAKAVEETGDKSRVLDLEKQEDRDRLTRLLTKPFRIETRRVLVEEPSPT